MEVEILAEELTESPVTNTRAVMTVFSVVGRDPVNQFTFPPGAEYAAFNIRGCAASIIYDRDGKALTRGIEIMSLRGVLDSLGCLIIDW